MDITPSVHITELHCCLDGMAGSLLSLPLSVVLFAAAGALAALQGKRDSLHRRCEGLLKCKNEFAELARAL
jgi:hypothetical protein